MKVLYSINLLGRDNNYNHERIVNVFNKFINNLKEENLIDDYGYSLKKVNKEKDLIKE